MMQALFTIVRGALAIIALLALPEGAVFAQDFAFVSTEHANMLTVQGTANGHRLTFILDSGSTHNVLDEAIGLSVAGKNPPALIEGHPGIAALASLDIRVNNLSNSMQEPTLLLDLSLISQVCGTQVDGVLGMPFLRGKYLSFYEGVPILSLRPIYLPLNQDSVECWKDEFGQLNIDVGKLLPDLSALGHCLIDTGMNELFVLDRERFVKLANDGTIVITGESVEVPSFLNDQVKPQNCRSGLIQFNTSSHATSIVVHEGNANLAGVALLQNFKATLSFATDELLLPSTTSVDASSRAVH